ncbi:MtrAB system histidine kinase MtrB [Brooklawnia sp.]|uniref:MtrAB system histidine kinase MtrB n=1 Tax=Brooklawnia sp. TaxID=2699740 RepID=UPI00311E9A9C
MMAGRPPRWYVRIVRLVRVVWGSSLPLRVIVMTCVASVFVLLLGGWVFLNQATNDLVDAKKQASVVEANSALRRMQVQLDDTDLATNSLLERLGQLASEIGSQPSQFSVMIESSSSAFMSRGLESSSVPDALRATLDDESRSLYVTLTQVRYSDGTSEPAVVVGGHLYAPSGQTFPAYFIFPASTEQQTLQMLQRDLASTGVMLMICLGIISYLVAREITKPLRSAGEIAGRIASGNLDQRMDVKGTDEMASLATSMNNMAAELQRQIGQLEDLSLVQQQFVSDVSHELRTPLTTMRMATEVLHDSRENFTPELARSVELLHDQEERFESMLGDLLEISRFDAGAALLAIDDVDLGDLVEAEIHAQQAMASAAGSELVLRRGGLSVVEADARRVQRIVRNLLTNAINHGERRPIVLTVAGDSRAVALTVRDHGVGFEPEQADQVFLRFWRADESRNRVVGGTGLGLAISLEDARLHHGWLEAWGRPGEGAQFRLTLPRNQQIVLDCSPLPLQPDEQADDRPPAALDVGRPEPHDGTQS